MSRKLFQSVFLFSAIVTAVASAAAASPVVDDNALRPWYKSSYTRGKGYPIDVYPKARGEYQQIYVCSGAGCPIRLKFVFTPSHRAIAEREMNKVCTENTAACELERLRAGVRALETIVWKDLLYVVESREIQKAWDRNSERTLTEYPGRNQQLTLDCVDQATNGTSYLIVLARWGLVRYHKIAPPGLEHLGFQPHFFTRLQSPAGGYLKFDLYDRSNTSLKRRLPFVAVERGNRVWSR